MLTNALRRRRVTSRASKAELQIVDLAAMLPTNLVYFHAASADPGGKDGDFWFNTVTLEFSVKLVGSWSRFLSNGGANVQPANGYVTANGNNGVDGSVSTGTFEEGICIAAP